MPDLSADTEHSPPLSSCIVVDNLGLDVVDNLGLDVEVDANVILLMVTACSGMGAIWR